MQQKALSSIFKNIISLYVLTLICLAPCAHAITVEDVLPNGLHITAEYRKGEKNKPAVLLMHGFLTVHTFNLIQKITDELGDNDFTVLAPTLSLGISKRKSTLACDALHLHSMDQDIDEIHWWVQWLINKGHRDIVLMGHSTGAMQIIHYANRYPGQPIRKLIAISLVSLGRKNRPGLQRAIDKATDLKNSGDTRINNFTIAYCDENYAAPASNYLSYAQWNGKTVLNAMRNIEHDITVIMGSKDDSAYEGWNTDMQQAGARVKVIENANHFFSTGYEFELYDKLIYVLEH